MSGLAAFHATLGWVAVAICGVVGLWGVVLRLAKREPARLFFVGTAVAVAAMLVQVGAGLVLFGFGLRGGSLHLFYGILILFAFAFAYIYRPQLARRPALGWGLLLLFVMGLGLRAITSLGRDLPIP